MAEFSDFTKLVLARMESNPEEFCTLHMTGYSRWQGLTRGLEALARGDTHAKDFGVLWPLTDEERAALLESYRKLYLNELHRDMLRNIVSGDDKQAYTTGTLSNDINPLKGGVLRSSTVATTASLAKQAQAVLEKEFDKQYAIGASDPRAVFGNVAVKGEGQPVKYDAKYQRATLNSTQVAVAKKMGISPAEYWAELQKLNYETLDND
jgi:hypothetical protein